ncbi:ABC transporter substrate-binding protein [Salinifilum ghardaiensis]
MHRHFRLASTIVIALVLALVAGCGSSGNTEQQASADGPAVKHAMGETQVPKDPKRVVVLDTGELDTALALGVQPVGTVLADTQEGLPSYLDKASKGNIQTVGTIGSPNLEKIASLNPDLILSSKVRDEERYGALSKIAPTVFSETTGKPWKENLRLYAKALGKEQKADQLMRDYEKRTQQIRKLVGGEQNAPTVSALRATGEQLRLYGTGSFIGTILEDSGLKRPKHQQSDETFTEISREQIGAADADYLFHSAYGDQGRQQLDDIRGSAQWTALKAVQNKHAESVPDDTWFLGIGPLAANRVLDDLHRVFSK